MFAIHTLRQIGAGVSEADDVFRRSNLNYRIANIELVEAAGIEPASKTVVPTVPTSVSPT